MPTMAGPSSTLLHPEPRPAYADITNSAFYSIEAIQDLAPSDLSNDINPIFRPQNFPAAGFDYTKIETSLRLASHFIDLALPIFHSVALCTPELQPAGTPGEYVGVLPAPGELTIKQQAKTRAMLISMAEVVTFELSSEVDEDPDACAVTVPGKPCTSGAVPGDHSVVRISQKLYTDVLGCSSDDPVRSFWFSFVLASTLYHELVHAAEGAASWVKGRKRNFLDQRVFIGESFTDELGFEAEAWLFGGIIKLVEVDKTFYTHNGKMTTLQGLICRFDWPTADIVLDLYADEEKYEGEAEACAPIYTRGSPDLGNIHCLWNVSFLSIANMFYDSFWQEQVTNLTGFPFKTSTGYRFDRTKAHGPLTGSVGLEDKVSRVPDGFELGEYGVLQRWKDGKPANKLSRKTAKLVDAFKAISLTKGKVPRRYRL